MTPAEHVIEHFGSIAKTARALGKPRSTVQGWSERGIIPQDNWKSVIDASEQLVASGERDRPLTPYDFINIEDPSQKRRKTNRGKRRKSDQR